MAAGEDQEAPSLLSLRREARTIYGSDAEGYDTGRPDYPSEVYEILASRCGLRAGASVVEIGPGTGLVTRRLVAAGARVVAVEPDQNMAAHLAAAVSSDVEIIGATSEQAALPAGQVRSRRGAHLVPLGGPGRRAPQARPGHQARRMGRSVVDHLR